MAIISRIPDNSRVRYPVACFVSTDLDGLGQYAWENAANTNVFLMDNVIPTSVYLVERVSFFANVKESDWLESMLTPADFPRVSIRVDKEGGKSIYGDPFRCVNYVDNSEQLLYFRGLQKDSRLVASMYGKVKQTVAMVGDLNLLAQINFTVYEIVDQKWIAAFERDPARMGLTVRV